MAVPLLGAIGVTRRDFYSEIVGQHYLLDISLPRGYASTRQHYPVLYLLGTETYLSLVMGIVNLLSRSQELCELMIVGIGYPSAPDGPGSQGFRDYTPTCAASTTAPISGGGAAFLSSLCEELIPHIQANYRVDPGRRAIMGASLGGLFCLYALFHRPELFSRYLVLSPALWWDNHIAFEYERDFAAREAVLPVRLFLSVGLGEPRSMVRDLDGFVATLRDRHYDGLQLQVSRVPEGTHQSAQPAAVTQGLLFGFPRQPASGSAREEASTDRGREEAT